MRFGDGLRRADEAGDDLWMEDGLAAGAKERRSRAGQGPAHTGPKGRERARRARGFAASLSPGRMMPRKRMQNPRQMPTGRLLSPFLLRRGVVY